MTAAHLCNSVLCSFKKESQKRDILSVLSSSRSSLPENCITPNMQLMICTAFTRGSSNGADRVTPVWTKRMGPLYKRRSHDMQASRV